MSTTLMTPTKFVAAVAVLAAMSLGVSACSSSSPGPSPAEVARSAQIAAPNPELGKEPPNGSSAKFLAAVTACGPEVTTNDLGPGSTYISVNVQSPVTRQSALGVVCLLKQLHFPISTADKMDKTTVADGALKDTAAGVTVTWEHNPTGTSEFRFTEEYNP